MLTQQIFSAGEENKLKSLKVAQSKDDNYGCKDDGIYGVVCV